MLTHHGCLEMNQRAWLVWFKVEDDGVTKRFSLSSRHVLVENAEGYALLEGVEWACEIRLAHVIFESNSTNVMEAVNGPTSNTFWAAKSFVDEIKELELRTKYLLLLFLFLELLIV